MWIVYIDELLFLPIMNKYTVFKSQCHVKHGDIVAVSVTGVSQSVVSPQEDDRQS